MYKITIQHLHEAINQLNNATNSPTITWNRLGTSNKANIGNFHLYQAYGAFSLHRIVNEDGGVDDIIGLTTKRDLYNQIRAMLNGISLVK